MNKVAVHKRKPGNTGTVCCVPYCKNNSKHNRNVSWNTFPKDELIRKVWLQRISRTGKTGKYSTWQPTKYSRICGAHFNEDGFKRKEDLFPRIFQWKVYTDDYNIQNTTVKSKQSGNRIGINIEQIYIVEGNVARFETIYANNMKITDPLSQVCEENVNSFQEECINNDHNYSVGSKHLLTEIRELRDNLVCLSEKCSSLESNNNLLLIENKELNCELKQANYENRCLQSKIKILKEDVNILNRKINKHKFCSKNILQDEKQLRFYTGFENIEKYTVFANLVKEQYKQLQSKQNISVPSCLPYDEQLFLFLCRLRVGLLQTDLGYRFNISQSSVSVICQFWADFFSSSSLQIPIWCTTSLMSETYA